jgi:hypothetical protein
VNDFLDVPPGQLGRPTYRDIDRRLADGRRAEQRLAFITRVMEIFSMSHADNYDTLLWRVDDGQLNLYANVSDVFAWGCADAEEINPERLPVLEQAFADLKAIGDEMCTAELYVARIRRQRPQGAAYPEVAKTQALFDACGPERPVGLGNPKRPPTAKPAREGDDHA